MLRVRENMNNKLILCLLVSLVGTVESKNIAQFAVALTQNDAQAASQMHQRFVPTEKTYRKALSWLFKNNPQFYTLKGFQQYLDYYTTVLPEHIKTLEGKIKYKKSIFRRHGMLPSVIFSTLSSLTGYGVYQMLQESKKASFMDNDPATVVLGGVTCGLISVICAAIAAKKLYKVYSYKDRLEDRLDRDKSLLAILEQEKASIGTVKAA